MCYRACFYHFNRIADGLDGAVARYHGVTDLGGYLDIVTDFIFYALVPLGFALHDPGKAQAAAFLVVSFIGTGSSFLAFAIIAAKEALKALFAGANRSIILSDGGCETIAVLVMMCLFPDWFNIISWSFGALCWVTTATRIHQAVTTFTTEKGS